MLAGWTIATKEGQPAELVEQHGETITEGVREITWERRQGARRRHPGGSWPLTTPGRSRRGGARRGGRHRGVDGAGDADLEA
jgi:hypothetical protein